MFDIGWSEMAIIMLLALIIIGPKDLPRVARTIGQWVRKGRSLAREFQNSLEDIARETELEDVKKEIEKVGKTDFKKSIENTIDPKGELTKAFDTSDAGDKLKSSATDDAGKETPKAAITNGHANGKAAPSAKVKDGTPSPSPLKAASVKAPLAKSSGTKATATGTTKTAATTKKAPVRKTAAAKKPVSAAKKSAKPAASTKSPGTKRRTAKPGANTSPSDEGGGTDQATVAAKPS